MPQSERYQKAEELGIDMESVESNPPKPEIQELNLKHVPHACETSTLMEYGNKKSMLHIDAEYVLNLEVAR